MMKNWICWSVLASGILAVSGANEYWEFGCEVNQEFTLSCPQPEDPEEARFVLVQNAEFGVYDNRDCRINCCVPEDADCKRPVDDAIDGHLEERKAECNMQESACTVEAKLSFGLSSCPAPSLAEFEIIHYICVYDDGSPPTTPAPTLPPTDPPLPSSTTESTTTPATTPTGPAGGTNIGAVIGGVLGGLCVVAIIILVALICVRRKQAQKAEAQRKLQVVNGRTTPSRPSNGGMLSAYANPAYTDEEMIIGNGEGPRIRALSKTESMISKTNSQAYENVDVADVDKNNEGYEKLNKAARDKAKEAEGDNISTSTGRSSVTHYENVDMNPSGGSSGKSPNVKPPQDNKNAVQNGSALNVSESKPEPKFEKKAGAHTKGKAPVAKKAASPSSNLNKAQSAMDISTQPKLEKSSPHKKSAPCLGTELSTTDIDIEGLKGAQAELAKSKPKSASAQNLKRRSLAESVASETIEEEPEVAEDNEKSEDQSKTSESPGPGKELF